MPDRPSQPVGLRPGSVPADDWHRHPCWGQVPQLTLVNGEHPCTRLVVVAAHPSDESLGAGGLIATAAAAGLSVYVVLLTAGEASPPHLPTLTRHAMATRRVAEAERALGILAPDAPLVFLGATDGGVAEAEAAVTSSLVDLIGDGRSTLLVAPWRHDGHGDHEAAGRAAADAAVRTGARLVEYPIRMWPRESPDEAPWGRMRRVDLSAQVTQRKRLAIHAHASQVRPLPEAPEGEVVLSDGVLAHFGLPVEHFVTDVPAEVVLEPRRPERSEPWDVDAHWHEQRKRQLTLAALPRPRFRRGLEVGGSSGALAAELAARCDELVTVDRGRWPAGRFDLVVVPELGHLLSPGDLDGLVARVEGCLEPGGTVVLCQRRHAVEGRVLDGPDVHDRFRESLLPPEAARYADRDVEISVLCAPTSWPEPTA